MLCKARTPRLVLELKNSLSSWHTAVKPLHMHQFSSAKALQKVFKAKSGRIPRRDSPRSPLYTVVSFHDRNVLIDHLYRCVHAKCSVVQCPHLCGVFLPVPLIYYAITRIFSDIRWILWSIVVVEYIAICFVHCRVLAAMNSVDSLPKTS